MFGKIIAFKSFSLIAACVFGRLVVSLPTRKLTSKIGPKALQFRWPSLKGWVSGFMIVERANAVKDS